MYRKQLTIAMASALITLTLTSNRAMAADPTTSVPPGSSTGGSIEADGTVNVAGFQLPPSLYLSEQSKAALPRKPTDPEVLMDQALAAGKAGDMRARRSEEHTSE